tara:strand:- start:967 stop:1959 length:993 start_codon:yes stop_codon:yes gene_type:complete
MYKLEDIKSIHLEVTSKCQAKCPMCARRVHGGPLLDSITLAEVNIELFKKWFSPEFIKQLWHLNMCGNLGDPIVAKDTLEIYQYLRRHNPTMGLTMHTNGSGRVAQWWRELAKINVVAAFGIDGLEDTHSRYRVNTNWNKIIDNAKTFIEAGGEARWDMLVFQHNQHQLEDCRALSKELGFKEFQVKHTTRFRDGKFDVIDENWNKVDTLYPSDKSLEMIAPAEAAREEKLPKINCKAVEDHMLYISAGGDVAPCCWLDLKWMPQLFPSKMDYMMKIKRFPNLHNESLKEIFDSGFFDLISSQWSTCGLKECSKQCGSFDKLREQFVEKK